MIVPFSVISNISKRNRWGESAVANSPIRHLCLSSSRKPNMLYLLWPNRQKQRAESRVNEGEREIIRNFSSFRDISGLVNERHKSK